MSALWSWLWNSAQFGVCFAAGMVLQHDLSKKKHDREHQYSWECPKCQRSVSGNNGAYIAQLSLRHDCEKFQV